MAEASRTRHAVLCGTDFTESAGQAAAVAAALAKAFDLPLLLLHISDDAALGPRATKALKGVHKSKREDLAALATRLRKGGVRVTPELHPGHTDEVIARRAGECEARLVVVGALGSRPDGPYRLGRVAERTAETAPVPTLVVRNAEPFLDWLAGKRPLSILVGFDFTQTSEAALDLVREWRRGGPCEVTVVYTNWPDALEPLGYGGEAAFGGVNPPQVQEALERSVQARVDDRLGEAARVVVQAARGRADFALIEQADKVRADVIVTGTHQQHGLARLVTPSVSRGVLQHATVSVATVPAVRASREVPPPPALRRVLVATDLSPLGNRAMAYAFAIARANGTVRVVHVVHPRALPGGEFAGGITPGPRHEKHVRASAERLAALIPPAASTGLVTESAVIEDEDPASAICREAERFGADVIVMGSQGRSTLGRVVLGSVAESVMSRSSRPVLVVRAPKS